MIDLKDVKQIGNGIYMLPIFRITNTGIEKAGEEKIVFCKGSKDNEEIKRQEGYITETILEICKIHLESVNIGHLQDEFTDFAIIQIKSAISALESRAKDRNLRNVQNTYKK